MRKLELIFACLACWLLLTNPAAAQEANGPWHLPVEVTDSNTKVAFEVDTTWHTVHGTTAGLSGKIWLADVADPHSLKSEIVIPVAQFDTDNSRRDSRMREVMASDKFPNVVFRASGFEGQCTPSSVETKTPCNGNLLGTLKIRDVEREVKIPSSIERAGNGFAVHGETTIHWRDFGVEDPSIIIAKLGEEVKIHIGVELK